MTEEEKLLGKLKLVEALYSGATTPGERDAAAAAKERLKGRLNQFQDQEPEIEYTFTLGDGWNKKLFLAVLRRHGIRPYRYYRQRHTTVRAKATQSFVDGTLWPEYKELSKILRQYLDEVTNRVISEAIHKDSSDAEEIEEPKQIGFSL